MLAQGGPVEQTQQGQFEIGTIRNLDHDELRLPHANTEEPEKNPTQSRALKFRLAPSLMPENQRAVTVLVLV